MKHEPRLTPFMRVVALAIALVVPLGTAPIRLSAATFYWDADTNAIGNDTATGSGLGGTGTWDTVTAAWYDGVGDVTWPNTGDTAVFTGPEATPPTLNAITVSAGTIASGISFWRSGYTLSGGDITLTGTPVLQANWGESATIDSVINGTAGFTKTGGGDIRLTNAANSYTGTTVIMGGTLTITSGGALGLDSSVVQVSGTESRGFGGGRLTLAGGYSSGVTLNRDLALLGLGPTINGTLNSVGNNTLGGTVTTALIGGVPNVAPAIQNTVVLSAGGTLTFGASSNLSLGGVAVTDLTQFGSNVNNSVGSAGNFAVNGTVSGAGSIDKIGSGTMLWNPSSAAGWSGTMRITGGSVRIANGTVLGANTSTSSNSVIDLNAGILEVRGDAPVIGKNVYVRNSAANAIFVDHAIGGQVVGQTATFGALTYVANENAIFGSRNGYGMTFVGNAILPQTGSATPSTFSNNMNGLLTIQGNIWGTAATTATTLTFNSTGDTLITGNILATGAAHNVTKAQAGTLTVNGTASTYTGNTNINGGTLAINDFRAVTNTAGTTINIGTAATAGVLTIGTTGVATAGGLTTNKVINLAGTSGAATINANQSVVLPVVLNSNFNATGVGAKTLTLGGTNVANNIVNGIIPNASGGGAVSIVKLDAGTWVLAGNNTYTGSTTINQGTLKILAKNAASNIVDNAGAIIFNANTTAAGGTLEFIGVSGVATTETLGALTPTAGGGTVKITSGGGGAAANLVFTSLGLVGRTASVNFDASGGGGGTISITAGAAAATATSLAGNGHLYVNGADFANFVGGVLTTPVYTSSGAIFTQASGALVAAKHNSITANIVSQATVSVTSLKLSGGLSVSMLAAASSLTVNSGLAGNDGGVLVTGGSSNFNTGNINTGGGGTLVIRVDGVSDVFTMNGIISTGTTGWTKTGAGTMVVAGINTNPGTQTVAEGTVRLSGSGRLSAANAAFILRQAGTLDLNGLSTGTAIGAFDGAGLVTNTSASPGTLIVGNATTGAGTFAGVIQDGAGITNVSVTGTTGAPVWSGLSTYTGKTTIGTGLTTTAKLVSVPNLTNIGSPSGIGRGDATNTATNAGSLVFGGLATAGINYTGTTSVSIDRLFTMASTIPNGGAQIANGSANNSSLLLNNTNPIVFAPAAQAVNQTLTLGGASTGDSRINLQITDPGGGGIKTSVTKIGVGQWVLGNSSNSYSGNTTISVGVLSADGATLPSTSGLVLGDAGTGTTPAIFDSMGDFTRNIVIVGSAGTNTVSWNSTLTGGSVGFSATSGKLRIAMGGVGTETPIVWGSTAGFFTGAQTGGLVFNNATVSLNEVEWLNPLDVNGGNRSITVNDNVNTFTDFATMSGVISNGAGGGFGIVKAGTGYLQLTGANTYDGVTSVTAGVITVRSLGFSANGTAPTNVGDQAGGSGSGGAVTLGNGAGGAASLEYVGPGEISDRMIRLNTTTGSDQIHANGSGPLILTNVQNDMVGGAKTLFLRGNSSAGNMITSSLADNGGALGVTIDGGATWILSGTNTFTGTLTTSNGGFGIGSGNATGAGTWTISNGTYFAYGADRGISGNTFVNQANNTTAGFVGDYTLDFTNQAYNSLSAANGTTVVNNIVSGKFLIFGTYTANNMTANRAWTVTGAGDTLVGTMATTGTFGTPITYTGTGSLTLNGPINNQNNATVTVSAGTLKNGASEVIPEGAGGLGASPFFGSVVINPAVVNLVPVSATWNLNGFNETINGLTATSAGNITITNSPTAAAPATLAFGGNNTAVNIGGGGGTYTISEAVGSPLSLSKIGTATATIAPGVTLNYTGATNVSGGTMNITSPVNGTTSISVTNGSTLALNGGITVPGAITSLTVDNLSNFAMLDGNGNQLTSLTSLTLGSASGTLTTLFQNVGDVSGSDMLATDTITLASGPLTLFAGNQIRFNLTDAGLNGSSTYNLLSVPGGGLTSGPLTMTDYLLTAPGGFTSFVLNVTDTLISVTTGTVITGDLFWRGVLGGGADDTWNVNVNNWATDKAGTAATSLPGLGTMVHFRADSATGSAALTTTLEQNFKVNAMIFEASTNPLDTPVSITIAPGAIATNRLEVAPSVSTDGVKILTGGSPLVTISAPLRLGADQTWEVADATSVLMLSGRIQGTKDVFKTGPGKVTMSALADPTFNSGLTVDVAVNGGTLEQTNAGALGNTVLANAARVAVNSTGAFYYNNAVSGTVNNPLTLGGGTLSAGGNAQTYNGTVSVTAPSFVNMRDQNSATIATVQRNITLSGVISGSGSVSVDSFDTLSSGNKLTGTLTLSNTNSAWSGGLIMNRGTVTATNVNALGTGPIVGAGFGRIIFNTIQGTTWNLAQNITLDAAGGILELSADSSSASGADMTVNLTGIITVGSVTNANNALRFSQAADNISVFNITNSIVLGNNSSLSYQGSATRFLNISAVISDGGGGFGLTVNDDLGGWAVTDQTVRLTGLNTFSGNVTTGEGVLEFDTVTNAGGAASALGQGTAITMAGAGTLRFMGSTSQATDRPIAVNVASTLGAAGTANAVMTFNGAITAATDIGVTLSGNTTSFGEIAGGLTQPLGAATADLTVASGQWTIMTNGVTLADDFALNGGTTTVTSSVTLNDDIVVTNVGTVLNMNTTGSWNTVNPAGTSSFIFVRAATVNLGANDINGVANANLTEGLILGDTTVGTGTLNTNGFNITVPRIDVGSTTVGIEGAVTGTGTLTITGTTTDWGQGIRLFSGSVAANLTGVGSMLKQGPNTVTLTGDNSGLAGTVAATRLDAGTLVLDYTIQNNSKISTVAALDMRGASLVLNGNASAPTSQTVASMTLAGGGNNLIDVNQGGGQDIVLNLGAITRGASQGTLRIELPAGLQSATNGVTTSTLNNASHGLVGASGFMTVTDATGTWFAANSTNLAGGNIVPVATTLNNVVGTWVAGSQISDDVGGFSGTLDGITIGSLRMNAPASSTLTLAQGGVLNIGSGGILLTSAVTTGSPRILNGTLATGVTEIIVTQDSTRPLEISADLRINNALTKTGSGTLLLSGQNVNTGQTTIIQGTVQATGGRALSDTGVISFLTTDNNALQILSSETVGRISGGVNSTTAVSSVIIGALTLTTTTTANSTYSGLITGTGAANLVKTGASNWNLNAASTAFLGNVRVDNGLFQLSGGAGQINAATFTVNGGANLLIDNNGTSLNTRILDTSSITLNSAGTFGLTTLVRGLSIRNSDNDNGNETVGPVIFNSGASYFLGEATGGTSSVDNVVSENFVRNNSATINARAVGLGLTTGARGQFTIANNANQTAFMASTANLFGGAGLAGTTNISIVPWAIGENLTAAGTDLNMGNTLVTYINNAGFRPLDFGTEYTTITGATATDNARESLAADLTGLAGTTVNALVLHNNTVVATPINVTGAGGGQTLAVSSGAMLFTLNTAAVAGAYAINLGGFDSGITVGSTNEYVIQVVNPSSNSSTIALTANITSSLTSAADITKSGRGDLVLAPLTGLNAAGGGANKTTINEGVLEIGDLDHVGGATGNFVFAGGTLRLGASFVDDLTTRTIVFLNGGGTIDTNGLSPTFAAGIGSGTGGLTKTGLGTLTLNGTAVGLTGFTTITTGTLAVGVDNAIGSGALTVNAGATLALGISNVAVGLVSTAGATPSITGTGTITSTVGFAFNHTGDTQIDAVLAGSVGLLKTQANILTLTGANTYSGTTEVQAGGLVFSTIENLGGGASNLGAPTTVENGIIRMGLTTAAVSLTYTGAGSTSDRRVGLQGTTGTVTLNGNGTGGLALGTVQSETSGTKTLSLNGTSATGITNSIGGVGIAEYAPSINVAKSGTNDWAINGPSTYTGTTTINQGTLRAGHNTAFSTSLVTLANTDAVVEMANGVTAGNALTVSNTGNAKKLQLQSGATSGGYSGTIDIQETTVGNFVVGADTAGTLDISGVISGATAGGVSKMGAGDVTFSGALANTYTGETTVSAGTLNLNKTAGVDAIIGDGASSKVTADVLINGGTLKLLANDQMHDSVNINITSGTLDFNGKNEVIYNLDNSGGTVNYGTGNVTIDDPTWSGGTNNVNGGTTFGFLNISGGTNTVFGSAGPGGGPGTLTIGTASTAGPLEFSGANNTPTLTLNSDAATPGTLKFRAGSTIDLIFSGTGTSKGLIASGGADANPGVVDLNGSTRTMNIGDAALSDIDMEIGANVLDGTAGTTGVSKTGAGTLKVSGANTYTGVTTVSAGTMQFGKQVSLYNNTVGSWLDTNIVVESGATAAFNVGGAGEFTSGDIDTLKVLGTGAGGFKNGSNIGLDTTNAGGSFSYSTGIANTNTGANSVGLQKLGTGALVLGGTNTYTGATRVKKGILEVVTTTGASTALGTTVDAGATLAGVGTISGLTATHSISGSVSPGASSGTGLGQLSFEGNLTFNANSSGFYEIGDPTLTYDKIQGTGTLTLDALHSITVTGFAGGYTPLAGDNWLLLDWAIINANGFDPGPDRSGGLAGTLTLPDLSGFGLTWVTSSFNTGGNIFIAPEPGRMLLMFFGLAALFLRRRRNR